MKKLFNIFLFEFIFTGLISSQLFAQERPNIIWLMAEDMSLDLECYGMPAVHTPNLNFMSEQGVLFNNCFVTNPICSPSRSAMMVGTHQVKINAHHHRSNRDVPLDKQFKPFTYWLREAGYTCILGHHGVFDKGRKIDVNFQHVAVAPWDGKEQFGLFDKLDHFEKEDQPFFAQIQLKVTHRGDWWNEIRNQSNHPVNPDSVKLPEFMADHSIIRLDWAKYLDQVEYMDNEVGMILGELEEKGMTENTIVIFIGDNGRCNIRGKGYLHDPGLHIPLIVYYPGGLAGESVRNDVVSATDITATIMDMAGIDLPEYMSGQPIFKDGFNREFVYAARDLWDEIEDKSRAITSGNWKYIRNDKPHIPFDAGQAYLEFYRPAVHIMRQLNSEGKLNEAEKLFFHKTKPVEELYNLANDPQELHNLAEDPDCISILESLRIITCEYDEKMKPVSDIYHPIVPNSVEVLEWVKNERPDLYQEMIEGVEIGLKSISKEYRKTKR